MATESKDESKGNRIPRKKTTWTNDQYDSKIIDSQDADVQP